MTKAEEVVAQTAANTTRKEDRDDNIMLEIGR